MLTLNQLKRRGKALANICFLCEENEETIKHLLIHCKESKDALGPLFDDCRDELGFPALSSLHSSPLARSTCG